MNSATLIIKNKKYNGILDMKCLKNIQYRLSKNGFNYRIDQLFDEISKSNMTVVLEFILCSLSDDNLLYEIINTDINDLFEYMNDLLEISLPKKKVISDEFESLELEEEKEDWDFAFMEYLWHTELRRTDDFWLITPKTFNLQVEIYKKMNSKVDNIEYL